MLNIGLCVIFIFQKFQKLFCKHGPTIFFRSIPNKYLYVANKFHTICNTATIKFFFLLFTLCVHNAHITYFLKIKGICVIYEVPYLYGYESTK